MAKITGKPQTWLYPTPAVMVSCQSTNQPNIITLAWAGIVCSNPVMIGLGIRPERYSYDIIKQSGEFVVNMAQANQMKLVDHCGVVSGREHDKFADCDFTALPGSMVNVPLIKECPVNLECQVKQVIPLGTHDLFIGEVVLVHYNEEFMVRGRFDLAAADPLAYGLSHYYRLGEVLGRHGDSIRKR